ncbi:hypothetical protein PVAG01_02090 [Phlyctema vagabunda]|uniref:Uncharacterized protein n=1 Tax=Phlyctema vagabunda TaxID=108571 RepID=A0ABR4PPQ2_9HELO
MKLKISTTVLMTLLCFGRSVMGNYSMEGDWANITTVRIEMCNEAYKCDVVYNGTSVSFALMKPKNHVDGQIGDRTLSESSNSSSVEGRGILSERYKIIERVQVGMGRNYVKTGTTNPVDLFHQAYDICHSNGFCDASANNRIPISLPKSGVIEAATINLRASGHYLDAAIGGLFIQYAEKAAEKGQT